MNTQEKIEKLLNGESLYDDLGGNISIVNGVLKCSESYIPICNFNMFKEKSKTDWSKVKMDTPILVTNIEGDINKYYFDTYIEETKKVYYFQDGRTSRTTQIIQSYNVPLHRVILDTSALSVFNWIKNDGNKPNCKYVVARLRSGLIVNLTDLHEFDFILDHANNSILEYFIIE